MAETVAEIMNPDFCHASQAESVGQLLHEMTALGLDSVPVLDLAGHPIGVATLGEIERCRRIEEIADHPRHPAISVHQSTTISEAARTLAQHKAEVLILVDDAGVAVGAVSALDLVRALLGLGVDRSTRSSSTPVPGRWSPSASFDLGSVGHVPAAPGIIVLARAESGPHPALLWAEATANLHERLEQMLRLPQEDAELEELLSGYPRRLSFRCMIVSDAKRRDRILRALSALVKRARPSPSEA